MEITLNSAEYFADQHPESSQSHKHTHGKRNPHANVSCDERFSRLCMFLEAQFGPDIKPITRPRLTLKGAKPSIDADGIKNEPEEDGVEDDLEDLEAEEMERLHSIGIPVPGVEIRVEKYVAKIWLETLEVECAWSVLRDRVKAVVERAVETVAPLWGQRSN